MKDTQLLSDLKALVEMGVVFLKIIDCSDWETAIKYADEDIHFAHSYSVYEIPSVEWVEGKIVEILPEGTLLDICYDKEDWAYAVIRSYYTPACARNPIRLNASVSLLRKLKESQTDRSE